MKESRGTWHYVRYIRPIWPNVPARTTFIYNICTPLNRPRYVHLWTYWTDWTDLGTFTSEQTEQTIEFYMNVPTYLIACNVHGPVSPAPNNCLLWIMSSLIIFDIFNHPFGETFVLKAGVVLVVVRWVSSLQRNLRFFRYRLIWHCFLLMSNFSSVFF